MRLIAQVRVHDRSPRFVIDGPATLRGGDGQPVDVVIENLSTTGFLMATDLSLRLGDGISIGIAGIGRHAAGSVRSTESGYGCMLLQSLPDALIKQAELHATFTIAAFSLPDQGTAPETDDDRFARDVRLLIIMLAISVPWLAIALLWTLVF